MLSKLVQDLHDLALSDVGALRYSKQPLELSALLTEQASLFAKHAPQLTLSLALPSQPLWVQADAQRLRQVLHNLLDNAHRYTQAGGRVVLRVRSEPHHAVIELEDSAPGVPDALLPRLFERFFRVDPSRTRTSGGSGLGLAICQRIIAAHGGHIFAAPSPLGGLKLTLQLPHLAHPETPYAG